MEIKALQHIKQRFGIMGNAPALNRAIATAVQVAPTSMSVLITGESGSGKESFSKIIHQLSMYKHGKFIAINCGAIPESTIDSELFGHEKGAFTDAFETRKGYFEEVNNGTIFLDEIAEMPLTTQARLLRILEYGEFLRVGSSMIRKVKVRVIAATHTDLLKAVYKGKFREDLYYRLNTVPIYVPPLRERGEDIHLLFRKFASNFAHHYQVTPIQLTSDAQDVLLKYNFPGNIRQLKNLVDQVSILEVESKNITKEQLLHYLPKYQDTHNNTLPAHIQASQHTVSDFTERAILYQGMLELKKEIQELKKLLFTLLGKNVISNHIIRDTNQLIEHNKKDSTQNSTSEKSVKVIEDLEPIVTATNDIETKKQDKPEIISEENLSVVDQEKELILKALHRNNYKRKSTAKSLGISERTLYRKLKQYNIED